MSSPHELQKLVKDFADRVHKRRIRVAVVGDMILDYAVEGVPGGQHPEIEVALLKDVTFQESSGGAANIALALARLGVDVSLFGIIGSDLPGRQLENLLDRQPFACHLVTERGWPTPRKEWIYHRQEGRPSLILRIDYDKPLPGRARDELVGEFRARCPAAADAVIFIDHGLGSIGPESTAMISLARERQAKLVAIPRTTVLRGQPLHAIVINSPEMRGMCGADAAADPGALAARYAREYAQHVFLTHLGQGLLICQSGSAQAGQLVRGYPLENPDWMGVRDISAVVIAVGLAVGLDPVTTGRLAVPFRHLIASQRGNGRVLWRDVFQFVGLPPEPA